MKSSTLLAAVTLTALTGCAIHQNVIPVTQFEGQQICVVENPAVSQEGFIVAYAKALRDKGYTVRQLPAGSGVNACPVTSTYTANWRWDLALYMAFADIRIYSNGKPSGQATYDALQGGGNMNKFIRGEEKIRELVDQLFPRSKT